MIPIQQTRFGYPEGNCLMACVASILEVPLDSLTDLFDACCSWSDEHQCWIHGDWWGVLQEDVRSHGWDILPIYVGASKLAPRWYAIAGGPSPRPEITTAEDGEDVGHAVVCFNGVMVHDPHPSGGGLAGPIDSWYVMIPPAT